MAWIESHQSLKDHPKLSGFSAAMSWDPNLSIGHLHRLWWWTLDYAPDGDLRKYNDAQIAHGMGVAIPESKRLVEALVEARWLDREPYFRVHDWWDYAGRFLQIKFKQSPQIWMSIRRGYVEGKPDVGPPATMKMSEWSQIVRRLDNNTCQLCGSTSGEMHAHHIKRQDDHPSLIFDTGNGVALCRECHKGIAGKETEYEAILLEKVDLRKVSGKYPESKDNQPNLTNQPNLSCGPPGQSVSNPKTARPIEVSPEEVYSAYPRKVGKPVALNSIKRAFKATPPAEVLAKTKAFAAATSQWPDDEKRFIPHPSTWFNQQRFNDDPETWKRSVPARPIAEIPVFVQIKHLEEAIAKHPANSESTFHRQDCTPDQQYDLREKRRKLNELKAKQ